MKSRTARLQAIKDRWFTEPLAAQFPSLGVEMGNPRTCDEYVTSSRIIVADEATNLAHFGIANPASVLAALSSQFESAVSGQVDPKTLKAAAVVLDALHKDSAALAEHYATDSTHRDDTLHTSYAADAKATQQCQEALSALAAELAIALPISNGGQRRQ